MVLDPVDGSTNASRALPWYATSLCAVDGDGARAALVVDQASGAAVRGGPGRRRPRRRPAAGADRVHRAWTRRSSACPGYPPRLVRLEAVPRPRRHRPRPVRGRRRPARRLRRLQPERPRPVGLPRRAARVPGGRRAGRRRRTTASSSPPTTPPGARRWRRPRRRCSSRPWRPAGGSSTRALGRERALLT